MCRKRIVPEKREGFLKIGKVRAPVIKIVKYNCSDCNVNSTVSYRYEPKVLTHVCIKCGKFMKIREVL